MTNSNLKYGKCLLYFSLNKQAKLTIEIDNYFSLLMFSRLQGSKYNKFFKRINF